MSISHKTILITRPQEQSVSFSHVLNDLGFSTVLMPLLDIRPVPFDIPDLTDFDGLIFTSGYAVRVFSEAVADRDIPVYCVGEKTKETACNSGWKTENVISGNIELLENAMMDAAGRFLHISGTDIVRPLDFKDAVVDRLIVYKADKVRKMNDDVIKKLTAGDVDIATFFSARTGEAFVEAIKRSECTSSLCTIKALCLSDLVVNSVKELPWQSVHVSETPDREGMIAALQSL